MRVLVLEPYYGGSHRALLDGWQASSRHELTLVTLPAHHWKWRMRHSPVTMAEQLQQRGLDQQAWDAIWCSSMLGLAEFRGLAPRPLGTLPAVAYFHENQLAYPVRGEEERDLHFAFTNLTTALAADAVWFNSAFNRDSLLDGLERLLERMPDYRSSRALAQVAAKSSVVPPGIEPIDPPEQRRPGPLRIVWAARWEHDKGPEASFEALHELRRREVSFRVSVLGQGFRDVPEVFARARAELDSHIERWGYQAPRAEYEAALRDSDVIVSTAEQEFFGLAVLEAVSAGCVPVLPNRLVYPELFESDALYDGTVEGLVARLTELAKAKADCGQLESRHTERVRRYAWQRIAPEMDAKLEAMVGDAARLA